MFRSSVLALSSSLLVLGLAAPAPALAPDGALARFVKPTASEPEAPAALVEAGPASAATLATAPPPAAAVEPSEAPSSAGEGAAPPDASGAEPAQVLLSPEAELDRVSAYLNTITTLEGRFLQVEPDGGLASGAFYLQRPGKVRFEYDPPHPSLIVADGATVAHQDRDLETIDRAPLRQTPLHLFLKANVDLSEDAEVLGLRRADGFLFVEVRDPDGEVEGELTLVFATPALELREWIVRDALGQDTRVMLQGVRSAGEIDPALFVLRDPPARRRGGR